MTDTLSNYFSQLHTSRNTNLGSSAATLVITLLATNQTPWHSVQARAESHAGKRQQGGPGDYDLLHGNAPFVWMLVTCMAAGLNLDTSKTRSIGHPRAKWANRPVLGRSPAQRQRQMNALLMLTCGFCRHRYDAKPSASAEASTTNVATFSLRCVCCRRCRLSIRSHSASRRHLWRGRYVVVVLERHSPSCSLLLQIKA